MTPRTTIRSRATLAEDARHPSPENHLFSSHSESISPVRQFFELDVVPVVRVTALVGPLKFDGLVTDFKQVGAFSGWQGTPVRFHHLAGRQRPDAQHPFRPVVGHPLVVAVHVPDIVEWAFDRD